MRTIMLWGGALGFTLAAVAGWLADRPLDLILRDAAAACLFGAWLLRWWWTQLERALTETVDQRRRESEAKAEAEEAGRTAGKPSQNKAAAAATATASRREAANPALARSATPASPRL